MKANTFFSRFVFLVARRGILRQIAIVAVLLLCIIAMNIAVNTSPVTRRIGQTQELAIAQKQYERDKADFEQLRKKHGPEAAGVVIR
jgi:hypothetical protein